MLRDITQTVDLTNIEEVSDNKEIAVSMNTDSMQSLGIELSQEQQQILDIYKKINAEIKLTMSHI